MSSPRRPQVVTLRRARVLLLAVAVAVYGGLGLLAHDALDATRQEQLLRHRAVAERVFDELERELTELIREEEARPFVHYRHLYFPDGQVLGNAVSLSPLAVLPREPHLVGYFQYNPDGGFVTPHAIHSDEAVRYGLSADNPVATVAVEGELEKLAAGVGGWGDRTPVAQPTEVPPEAPPSRQPRPSVEPRPAEPLASAEPLPPAEPLPVAEPLSASEPLLAAKPRAPAKPVAVAKPASAVPQVAQRQSSLEDWQFELNNESAPRQGRASQKFQAPVQQVDNFAQQGVALTAVAPPPPPAPPAPERSTPPSQTAPVVVAAPPVAVAPSVSASTEPADVEISPMQVQTGPKDTVLFSRTVTIDARTWVQGAVFRRSPLQAVITRDALGDAEVLPFLQLDWEGEGDLSYAYRFGHTFDAPFGDWHVTASLAPLSGSTLRPVRYILLWSVLVGVVVLVGLTKTYQTLVQSMEYARQRDNFVAAVSHELKSPLTAIRMYSEMLREGLVSEDTRRQQYYETIHGMYSEMLREGLVSEDTRRQQYYETIHGESERLSRLVDDVLTYSRLEGGRQAAAVTGSVGEATESVASLFEPFLAQTERRLMVEVDPAAAEGRVDQDALVQVLTNLLDNAFKFSAEAPEAPVSLAVTREGDAVVLRVRDHGPGVAPGLLRTMFEPFVRGEDELVRKTKGTGLGLALVRGLVESTGGSVGAANPPDGGLEVVVT
ncbi:MAG: hypothetical protein JRJ84_22810, partial [Deltaproteobacteria bacterium]|nr:hypothetical protein [Deltaproteobacteria bacterium]